MIMLRPVLFASFALTALACWAQAQDTAPQAVAALQQLRNQLRDAKELEFTTQFHVVDKVLGKGETPDTERLLAAIPEQHKRYVEALQSADPQIRSWTKARFRAGATAVRQAVDVVRGPLQGRGAGGHRQRRRPPQTPPR